LAVVDCGFWWWNFLEQGNVEGFIFICFCEGKVLLEIKLMIHIFRQKYILKASQIQNFRILGSLVDFKLNFEIYRER
jgi:hypothetical protein